MTEIVPAMLQQLHIESGDVHSAIGSLSDNEIAFVFQMLCPADVISASGACRRWYRVSHATDCLFAGFVPRVYSIDAARALAALPRKMRECIKDAFVSPYPHAPIVLSHEERISRELLPATTVNRILGEIGAACPNVETIVVSVAICDKTSESNTPECTVVCRLVGLKAFAHLKHLCISIAKQERFSGGCWIRVSDVVPFDVLDRLRVAAFVGGFMLYFFVHAQHLCELQVREVRALDCVDGVERVFTLPGDIDQTSLMELGIRDKIIYRRTAKGRSSAAENATSGEPFSFAQPSKRGQKL